MVEVLKSGFYTTIQDQGRFGFQDYGVPYAGAMDRYAASVVNMLVGNDADASVLEMTMMGPTLQFHSETIICLSGAEMSPLLNNVAIENNKAIQVAKNAILSFGKLKTGFRGYLSVFGGFKTEKIMQSRSMFKGVTVKHIIRKGDALPILGHAEVMLKKNATIKVRVAYLGSNTIPVFKG